MRSDALFYELFQTAPQTFFELLQITPPCPYRFESLTVKSAEKRIDGILEPEVDGETIYFLEIQAYFENTIYWRTLRETATYFEQRPHLWDNEWQAVVLFLKQTHNPGFRTLSGLAFGPSPRLIAVDLIELLPRLDETSLTLNVLRPLIVDHETEVRDNVLTWATSIRQATGLNEPAKRRLIAILAQFIEQKFKALTYKELSQMLELTPLEETISGREILHDDRVKMLAQQVNVKFSLSPEDKALVLADLENLDLDDLESLFTEVLKIETVEELQVWIQQHLPEDKPDTQTA